MRFIIITLFVVGFGQARSQSQLIGKPFPAMETETVNDIKVKLPESVKGKFTLLGLAYSKKAEDELFTWFQPIFEKFIDKPQGIMKDFGHDVNVFFVPMLTGVNAAATGMVKRKALKTVDPQLLPYVLFYKGQLKSYKESLNFDSREVPYFFVLDPKGIIVYVTSGLFTEEKLDAIESVLE
jgi:hypothetical protein